MPRLKETRRIARAAAALRRPGVSIEQALALCPYRTLVGTDNPQDLRDVRHVMCVRPGLPLEAGDRSEILDALGTGLVVLVISPCERTRDKAVAEVLRLAASLDQTGGGGHA